MCSTIVGKTFHHFGNISDPRVNRGENYPLTEMIFLTLTAMLSGSDTWVDVERFGQSKLDWLQKYLPFAQGIPSHNTLGRVFSMLDTVEFYAALQSFAGEIIGTVKGETVALDGKTLRGSFDNSTGKSALHCGLQVVGNLLGQNVRRGEVIILPSLNALAARCGRT